MSFIEKIKNRIPTLSFELFPPKKPDGWATLYGTLSEISRLSPDLVSVTYGAGGSTRQKTIEIVTRLKDELNIEGMAHIACVNHTRDEIDVILNRLRDAKIRYILALRGDPPQGTKFNRIESGFGYASELIRYTKLRYNNSTIGCATYPEKHIESKDIQEDIEYLKLKQDEGAEFAITQLFFINENFFRFRDMAVKSGVNIPIIAGIMPVMDLSQLERFRNMCGCSIPDPLRERLIRNPDRVIEIGIEYSLSQCEELLRNDVAGIHFFTLNRSQSVVKIVNDLRESGYFRNV